MSQFIARTSARSVQRQAATRQIAAARARTYVAPPPGPGTYAPPPPKSGGPNTLLIAAVVVAAAAGGYYFLAESDSPAARNARAKADSAAADAKSALNKAGDAAQQKASEVKADAKSAGRDIQSYASKVESDARSNWEKTKKNANETWEEAKAKFEKGTDNLSNYMSDAEKKAYQAYNDIRTSAKEQTAEVKAQAEGAYAKALSKGSSMSDDAKTYMDQEYARARANQAGYKAEKVAEGGKGWFSWATGK